MSPTSYQTAPLRDIKNINGGERGIRTPAPFPTSRFSRPVPSTRLGYFSTSSICHPRRQMNYIISFFLMSTDFIRKYYDFHKKTGIYQKSRMIRLAILFVTFTIQYQFCIKKDLHPSKNIILPYFFII